MTIKQIIKTTAVYLGRDDIIAYLDGELFDTPEDVLKELEQEVNSLTKCANLVINQLATEYVPLKSIDVVRSDNGQILYTSFPSNPIDILAVYDVYGNKLEYKILPLYLLTKPEAVKVEYTYLPPEYNLEETIAYTENKVPIRIIAYGVTAEYTMISGRFDEAILWDKRYKNSILNILMPKNSVIKGRYWR
jgi:hypothetical protein